jgi:cytochrome c
VETAPAAAVAAPAASAQAPTAAPATPVAADAVAAPAAAAPATGEAAAAPTEAPATQVAMAEAKPTLSQADGLALLKKSNCLLCHSIEKKVVGPAYKDVAAKYRGQPDAEARLFTKVTTGGKGVWGQTPMPAQMANRDDIRTLIHFVLALK